MNLFRIETHHKTSVYFDPSTNSFCHDGNQNSNFSVFLVLISDSTGLIVSCDSTYICNNETAEFFVQHPVLLRRSSVDDVFSFLCCRYYPGDRFYCAEPPTTGTSGRFVANRQKIGIWEYFRLIPIEFSLSKVDEIYIAGLRELALARPPLSDIAIMLESQSFKRKSKILLGYISLLGFEKAAILAEMMAEQPSPVALFNVSSVSTDPWVKYGMAQLLHWLGNRDISQSIIHLSSDYDWLKSPASQMDFGTLLLQTLRKRVVPRRMSCVVASARNEGVYFLEWIAYHRSIGFEHIFIYTNDNDDESDILLEHLANDGVITLIRNTIASGAPQMNSYAHALGIFPEILDYRWTLFIDVDEYFVFDAQRFTSINDYLRWQQLRHVDCICLNWVWYGTRSIVRFESEVLLTERFKERDVCVNKHIKSMFRPGLFYCSHPHFPIPVGQKDDVIYRDSNREVYRYDNEFAYSVAPVAEAAWINHYWSKSLEEVLCKFSRNRGDRAIVTEVSAVDIAKRIIRHVLDEERSNSWIIDLRIHECSKCLRTAIDELLNKPGVRFAFETTSIAFQNKITYLRESITAVNEEVIGEGIKELTALLRIGR